MSAPEALRLADELEDEQTWVCPDSPEHRYAKPGHCEDCGKTLVLAQEQGCDHCNQPLYAATKCRVCGRVTEQAEPKGGGNLPPPLQEPAVAENATTQQQLADTPPSDYRRGYWDGFAIGKREGRIEAEDAAKQAKPVAWMEIDDHLRERLRPGQLLYTAPPMTEPVQEPVAWMYTGIKQDGTEHGPHLVWKPEYMDAMSASKGAKATPLYTVADLLRAQQAEPVAWMDIDRDGTRLSVRMWSDGNRDEVPLYTAPPQRKPLTDEEIDAEWQKASECAYSSEAVVTTSQFVRLFARAVERAHGIGGQE